MTDQDARRREARAQTCMALIGLRRLIGRHIGFKLSADPVWDMLLDLYISEHRGRDIAISSLASVANVPATTALRSIRVLVDLGLVMRHRDSGDGRRVYIRLSETGAEAMRMIFDSFSDG